APLIGALIAGIDRKVTARMQSRIGPPLLQPIYDVMKLFRKDPIALNKMQILYAYLHLAFMIVTVMLLLLGQDMLLILFTHAFSTISLVLGGMSVRSPYSRIGAQRKIMQMVAYEPILVLMVVGIYLATPAPHSWMAGDVFRAAMDGTMSPLLLSLPLVFLAFLMAIGIKLNKSPFDVSSSHHAHQELVKGITLEYSGPYLGIIVLAHFYEGFLLLAIVAAFWLPHPIIGVAIASTAFTALIVMDNVFARLTCHWMLKYMWTVGLGLAMANIIWLH
ncbi:MAG: NADH-quinone oxidoreductase subunit H, partial [Planctomycetaceae bacterium]